MTYWFLSWILNNSVFCSPKLKFNLYADVAHRNRPVICTSSFISSPTTQISESSMANASFREISPRRSEQSSFFQRVHRSVCVRSSEWWRFEWDWGIAEFWYIYIYIYISIYLISTKLTKIFPSMCTCACIYLSQGPTRLPRAFIHTKCTCDMTEPSRWRNVRVVCAFFCVCVYWIVSPVCVRVVGTGTFRSASTVDF